MGRLKGELMRLPHLWKHISILFAGMSHQDLGSRLNSDNLSCDIQATILPRCAMRIPITA